MDPVVFKKNVAARQYHVKWCRKFLIDVAYLWNYDKDTIIIQQFSYVILFFLMHLNEYCSCNTDLRRGTFPTAAPLLAYSGSFPARQLYPLSAFFYMYLTGLMDTDDIFP